MLSWRQIDAEVIEIGAGFLIPKTFARLYGDYKDRYDLRRDVYAMPRIDREPAQSRIQYRGLDRDALIESEDSDLDAEVQLALLWHEGRAEDGLIFSRSDLEEVYSLLGPLQSGYEVIWCRVAGRERTPPDGYRSAGFEATYFTGDHFSPSCDCMLFPRWHGTDEEGELFLPYFRQLNAHGLFATPAAAQEFLQYYLSFDWTEQDTGGDYVIAEVFVPQAW
jgi:hypothetical protein